MMRNDRGVFEYLKNNLEVRVKDKVEFGPINTIVVELWLKEPQDEYYPGTDTLIRTEYVMISSGTVDLPGRD